MKVQQPADTIKMPASTVWPLVLALGASLILAAMVTSIWIGALGFLLAISGSIGWFRQVLRFERHQVEETTPDPTTPVSSRSSVARLKVDPRHRKMLPIDTYSVLAGVKGGIAGGVAMVVPAMLYGLIKYSSIWYAVNLLAAGGFVNWAGRNDAFFAEFHARGFFAALAIHAVTCLLVGLLYGAMLPMFPRLPILTAGFMAPLLWTGLLYSVLGIINPILNQRIDWVWFAISQCCFGLVAGFVVNLDDKIRTPQFRALPFAVRAGLRTDSEGSEK